MKKYLACALLCAVLLWLGCDDKPLRLSSEVTPIPIGIDEEYGDPLYSWEVTAVDQNRAGLQTVLAVNSEGDPTVAYFSRVFEIPEIELPFKTDPSSRAGGHANASEPLEAAQWDVPDDWELPDSLPFFELRYATWDGYDWLIEVVDRVARARGFSLLQGDDGETLISYQVVQQDSDPQPCATTELHLAQRNVGRWSSTVVAELEDETAPSEDDTPAPSEDTPSPSEGDDDTPTDDTPAELACQMVGAWSSLGKASDGQMGVVYRRAFYDLENYPSKDRLEFVPFSLESGTPDAGVPRVVDSGIASGFFADVAYARDSEGRQVPYVAYYNRGRLDQESPQQYGLWLARYDYDQDDWTRIEIQSYRDWMGGPNVQLLVDGDEIYVAVYAWTGEGTTVLGDLVLLHSPDLGSTWTEEYVATAGRSGGYPSMAMNSKGELGISYYGCGASTDAICKAEYDGLKLAVRRDGEWHHEVVAAIPEEKEGTYTSLVYVDDLPVIAARSSEPVNFDGEENRQILRVYFGSKN